MADNHFINSIISWSKINKLGKINAVKYSFIWLIVVPISARLAQYIYETYSISIGLPFSWKIFYFAAMAFTLSSLIYSSLCPDLLKKCNNFDQFESKKYGSRDILISFVNIVGSASNPNYIFHKNERVTSFLTDFVKTPPAETSVSNIIESTIDDTKLKDAFWKVYYLSDQYLKPAIVACYIFYIIGFSLLGILIYQNIEAVITISIGQKSFT